MKKIISVIWMAIALFTFALGRPALATEAATEGGTKIFSANCAACHAGGRNVIMADKSLNKEALEKYGMDSSEAIVNQVTKGKNAMPAFKGRLSATQIEDVASYVLDKAEQGWK